MSDVKREVERLKGQFNDADVKKRNIVVGLVVLVVIGLVLFALF